MSSESAAKMFGPAETKAIFANKRLEKLTAHLRTWPGGCLPWSIPEMPRFCADGFDLVVLFEKETRAIGLPFPDDITESFRQTYPWDDHPDCPFVAADHIRVLVNHKVHRWTNPSRDPLDEQVRKQIDRVIDKVTLGAAEGVWPEDKKLNANFATLERLNEKFGNGKFERMFYDIVSEEVEKRVGKDAPEPDYMKASGQVIAQ